MPEPSAHPTLAELRESLDRVNQSLMVTALSRRFAENGIKAAAVAAVLSGEGQIEQAWQAIGESQAYTRCANLALAVAQEL